VSAAGWKPDAICGVGEKGIVERDFAVGGCVAEVLIEAGEQTEESAFACA
jgi:hypothetical protein